jgi:ribosomal protein S18 acetylase RimI-like enzyme
MTEQYTVNNASLGDLDGILKLYLAVAALEGGLARTAKEISLDYVKQFITKSAENGIIVVARDNFSGDVIGEIHGYAIGPKVFSHVLGELTIAVHPERQGIGIGKAIFTEFMRRVKEDRPDILRVELIARESNRKAIAFYEKLGFVIEGRFVFRIQSVGGGFEDDIPMAWTRDPY